MSPRHSPQSSSGEQLLHEIFTGDPAGNAKQQAAAAGRAAELVDLRLQVTESLTVLVGLAAQLEDLADARQPLRARVVTEESLQVRAKQTQLDRAAARGVVGRNPDRTLAWMSGVARIGTGQVQAPVQTLPALSVVAEIRYTLRYAIARLGRPAKLVALEVEQTAEEDHGYCPWPRHPLLTAVVDVDDQGIGHLAARLALLVDAYTNRKELKALARDLEHLEESALDVTEGMAGKSPMQVGSETCPWCGRDTLAILSRVPGQHALVIRCEGDHRCECTWDFCDCHRNPRKNRHEWINSGSAAHTFHELKNLQTKRKELTILETKALDAIDRIRAMHVPTYEVAGVEHRFYVQVGSDIPADHVCVIDGADRCDVEYEDHIALACVECRVATDDGLAGYHFWPCPTARACDLDTQPDDSTTNPD